MEEDLNEQPQGKRTFANAFANITRTFKGVFKAIGKFIKWIGTFLGSLFATALPYILIIVVIIAVLFCIIEAITAAFDAIGGFMSSIWGVNEDKFHGTRYVYYDEEYTTNDLKDKYLEFTYNLVSDVNNSYTIEIDYTKAYNESSQINAFCLSFARAINPDLTNATLDECTKNISHYGFDETNVIKDEKTEKELMLLSLANSTYPYLTNKGINEITLYSKFKELYELPKYDYMRNVCAKILIKDYILADGQRAIDIPKKNYVGFVYMPKESVVFKKANFAFGIDEEKTVNISANYKRETLKEEIKTDIADSTWIKNGDLEKSFDCELNEYIFTEFTAIDEPNLLYLNEPKTLFDICRDNKFNKFFKEDANKNDVNNLLDNVNTNNYFYLKLNSDSPYNMAESFVEYE